MKKLEITIGEAIILAKEIMGGEGIDKPIISQKISFKEKLHLHRNFEKLAKEQESFKKTIDEMIKKYGTEDDNGQISVKLTIKDKKGVEKENPNFALFRDEYNEVSSQKINIELNTISPESLDFSDEAYYPLITKYLVE